MRDPKKIIICNWKEHGTIKLLHLFLENIYPYLSDSILLIHCPPIHLLGYALHLLQSKYRDVQFASQIISKSNGTGSVTGHGLNGIGCKYSLCGHSEYYDPNVIEQIRQCKKYDIYPLCCFSDLAKIDFSQNDLWIYEPIDSIGTGKPASIANIMHISDVIRSVNRSAKVLYGGSVNSSNSGEILKYTDGLCIGSASRDENEIRQILHFAKNTY